MILSCLCIFLSFIMSSNATAKTYEGYKNGSSSKEKLIERIQWVDRFYDEKEEFLILFNDHPALYVYPKKADAADFKKLITESHNKKKEMKFLVDEASSEIISVTTDDKKPK
jgi:hypothetical protein